MPLPAFLTALEVLWRLETAARNGDLQAATLLPGYAGWLASLADSAPQA